MAGLEVAPRTTPPSSRMSSQGNLSPSRCCWIDYPLAGRVYSPVASPPSSAFLRIRGKSLVPAFRLPHPLLDIPPGRTAGRTTGSALELSPGPAVPVLTWTPHIFHGTHRHFCLTHLAILGPFLFPFLRISLHISKANFNFLVRFEYSPVKD